MSIQLHATLGTATALLVAASACAPDPTAPRLAPGGAPLAASPSGDTRSRALLAFAATVTIGTTPMPAGIRGDGRDRLGQPTGDLEGGDYQGDLCGVRAILYDGKNESGSLQSDLDLHYGDATRCGAPRTVAVHLGDATSTGATGTVVGAAVMVPDLLLATAGSPRLQPVTVGMQEAGPCALRFEARYAGASDARVTRLADLVDAQGRLVRQWRVESQGSHAAACLQQATSGKLVDTGRRFFLPFALTITQVPVTASGAL